MCLIAPQHENVKVSVRPQLMPDGKLDRATTGNPPRKINRLEKLSQSAG
ncbi:hypothetical protein GCM10010271_34980 [Streptomyces kurssanovii]|nr:hypothetical protein GCM10010271_34980 [Streptomyces kurssanovii]